jgi:hypothetical protein
MLDAGTRGRLGLERRQGLGSGARVAEKQGRGAVGADDPCLSRDGLQHGLA